MKFPVISAFLFLSVAVLSACNQNDSITPVEPSPTDSLIQEAEGMLQPGDLVLRSGRSYASEQIRELMQKDRSYSHAGIVIPTENGMKVCSIEPKDNSSPTDSIRYEKLSDFVSVKNNNAFAVYRYDLLTTEKDQFVSFIK